MGKKYSDKAKLFEEKVIKYKGARHYLIKMEGEDHFKHHRYDEPAIVPLSRKSEFKMKYKHKMDELMQKRVNDLLQNRTT